MNYIVPSNLAPVLLPHLRHHSANSKVLTTSVSPSDTRC